MKHQFYYDGMAGITTKNFSRWPSEEASTEH